MLEDKALNKFINLSQEPSYTFTMGEGTAEHRFVLHFTTGGAANGLAQATVFANGNTVTINSTSADNVATQVAVVDALGRVVKTVNNDTEALNLTFQVTATPGIYFVKLQGPAGEMTKRVILGQ
jgi:UDP-N-acetylglucosamine enolpyruvyl transferase